jgi:hypothetical protein
VSRVYGQAFAFFGDDQPIRKLKEDRLIQTGTIVATGTSSMAYLEFNTNGVIVVAPNSQVMMRSLTKNGLRQVSLIKGSLYFRSKRSLSKNRPAGVIINIRSYSTGYYGENYSLTFTQDKREISVKTGIVTLVKMNVLTKAIQSLQTKEALDELSDGFDAEEELIDEFDAVEE